MIDTPFHIVIPARYGSTRLHAKPLALVGGKPMILRVVQQAMQTTAESVIVAGDHPDIIEAVQAAGFQAMLTDVDHPSGSDRIMEVAIKKGWPDDAIVINVQGDEPLIPPPIIEQVANGLKKFASRQVFTLCERMTSVDNVFDPNQVKVTFDSTSRALYFSRSPIPFAREHFALGKITKPMELPANGRWYRHIGIYGYRLKVLRQFVELPPSALEQVELLEQLRLLENGIAIHVDVAEQDVPQGVDTPEDLNRVNSVFKRGSGIK